MAALVPFVVIAALVIAGCGGDAQRAPGTVGEPGAGARVSAFGAPPAVPDGPLDPDVEAAADGLGGDAITGALDQESIDVLAGSEDARLGWLISDLLRFDPGGGEDALVEAFTELSGVDVRNSDSFDQGAWVAITDHLIAWDLPAPPGYRERKAVLFLALEPGWEPFFEDADSEIDWRLVSWGGVFIDNRPLGDDEPCPRGCIPALDDPPLTPADEGDWYPDERTVFGVVIDGQAVALPKNIMEIHEMVNLTVAGRRLGIPYCTLCGSAQAYFLDADPRNELVLRTSGLLSRSNKFMYELTTQSAFDTFTGEALSGPLQDAGVTLEQTTVVGSTWGAWKRDHPNTTIIAQDGGIGRDYPLDPLGDRDANGPIFPVGDVDPRLPVQAQVLGVIAPNGTPVAFGVDQASDRLADGEQVSAAGIELLADGDGLRAQTTSGRELPAHQAFWFAWSQFHPRTDLWTPPA